MIKSVKQAPVSPFLPCLTSHTTRGRPKLIGGWWRYLYADWDISPSVWAGGGHQEKPLHFVRLYFNILLIEMILIVTVERNTTITAFYHPILVATCCNVRLHLSSMGGGRIRGRRGWGGLRHILCPYMGMKFTRSGESSHWSWWMGRRAEGAAKVYIRRERGSRWCEIHSKQIPTEEQRDEKEYL